MSEAEVGVFVQRLRGLMNEIGEGPGVRRRRAFRGPCWSQPHPTHHSKDRTVSVVSSVERQMIGGGGAGAGNKEFYKGKGVTRVQRAFLPVGALSS